MNIEEYKLLITSQYQNSTKFLDWLEANLEYSEYCFDIFLKNHLTDETGLMLLDEEGQILEDVLSPIDVFDIDVAIGMQLDILGVIIGVSRTLDFDIYFPSPSDRLTSVLEDDDYRILLKATIIKNHWRGRIQDLYDFFNILIPDINIVIKDNQDMSMTIGLFGNINDEITELITRGLILPKPMGVLINYFFGTLPIFGYDFENTSIAGYDSGNWTDYSLGA